MTYQLANAKVWDGSAWVQASGGGGGPWWTTYKQTLVSRNAAAVTCDTAAHTKGAWTELIASSSANADCLMLSVDANSNSTNTSSLVDVGIGASGSETVVVPNLAVGGWFAGSVFIPLQIPSGTRVAVRGQSVVTGGRVLSARVALFDTGTYADAPTSVDVLGSNTADSTGLALSSTLTYFEVISSSSTAYRAVIIVPSLSTNFIAGTVSDYTLATGASGSETAVGSLTTTFDSDESHRDWRYKTLGMVSGPFPAGTRFAAQASVGGVGIRVCVIGIP